MTAYKIKGNNYVKLRDIGKTINFGISFNMDTKAVSIDPNGTYVEEVKPTPSTPTAAAITKWNSTMDEFNEEMIQNHSDRSSCLLSLRSMARPLPARLMRPRSTISRSACIGQSSSAKLTAKPSRTIRAYLITKPRPVRPLPMRCSVSGSRK